MDNGAVKEQFHRMMEYLFGEIDNVVECGIHPAMSLDTRSTIPPDGEWDVYYIYEGDQDETWFTLKLWMDNDGYTIWVLMDTNGSVMLSTKARR